jgi:outer membrane immunogenic protein
VKKFVLVAAAAAAFGFAGSASAADMPTKAPILTAPVTPVYNWTGLYVGGNVGGAWLDKSVTEVGLTNTIANPIGSTFSLNEGSVMGGLQTGYNWQHNNFLVGVEGDVNWTGINKDVPANAPPNILRGEVDWFATFRGRVGYTPGNWLIYITGGGAVAKLINGYGEAIGGVLSTNSNDAVLSTRTRWGWTVGGGVEVGLWGHWSAKAEYLYIDFGDYTVVPLAGVPGGAARFKDQLQVARICVNYRF